MLLSQWRLHCSSSSNRSKRHNAVGRETNEPLHVIVPASEYHSHFSYFIITYPSMCQKKIIFLYSCFKVNILCLILLGCVIAAVDCCSSSNVFFIFYRLYKISTNLHRFCIVLTRIGSASHIVAKSSHIWKRLINMSFCCKQEENMNIQHDSRLRKRC